MKNSWLGEQRETRPQRPEGLCGPLSFVIQRDDFAYVGTGRPRMDLSATTKVWIHKGVPRSAVVTFVCTERWAFAHKSLQSQKDANYIYRKEDKSENTDYMWKWHTRIFRLFHKDLCPLRKAKTTAEQLKLFFLLFNSTPLSSTLSICKQYITAITC